jgi:hypothetical protein
MEHRGITPPGGVAVDDLRDVVSTDQPMVTVLLATGPVEANPGPRWAQRWKTVRRELERMGAEPAALTHLDDVAAEAYRRGSAFYAVADVDRVWVSESWPGPVRDELLRVGRLPSLAPLLARRQRRVPHVVALVDRQGADIVVVERDGDVQDDEVTGERGPVLRKSGPGGWSQRRYQDRAEESWARTAQDIADAIVADADRVDAEVIVVAGDVREVALVRDALPTRVADRVHVIEGGRAAGTDDGAREHEIERLLDTAVADATVALLRKLREELGQHDRGVVGSAPTFDALGKGQVEVLLVHDDPADDRTAWFGEAPTMIGVAPNDVADGAAAQARLVDVAIRAAIGTGAEVRVVPSVHALPDGLGGILRWAADT